MAGRQRINPAVIAVAAALAVVIFLTDLSLPLGVAGGVPYVALVLVGWWFPHRSYIFVLAAVSSVLTVAGYLFSPEDGIPWVVLTNRFLAFFAIWVTAVLTALAKGAQEALQASNEELERRVKQRTRKLTEAMVGRGRAQEALREREQRLRLILDSLVVGVITIDQMGVVQSFNPGAERIFGYGPDEVVGKSVNMLVPEPHRSRYDSYIATYLKTGEAKIIGRDREVEGRRKDGSIFPMELEVGEMMVGGRRIFAGIARDITERKRAEEALRESEERFRRLVETTNVIVWEMDLSTWRFTYVSPPAVEILGYPMDDWYGESFWTDHVHPDDREQVFAYCAAATERGEDHDFEYRMIAADGRTVWLRDIVTVLSDADGPKSLQGVMIDITERKRAEEILRESEERFRTLIDSSSQGILVHRNLCVLYANQRFVEMFGYDSADEILALESRDVMVAPEERSRLLGYHKARLRGEPVPLDYEFVGLRKDGSRIWLENRSFRIEWEGGPAICTTLFDITERNQAQAQLVQASKLATLGEMASGIAHELNQPLSVVGMAAELSLMSMAEGEFDTEFVRRKLETIVGQKERMAGIVNHMRLFSRKDKAELESFDPLQSVSGAVRLIDKQFHASGIDLEEDLPASSRHVSGHPAQLEQVVLNLLTNARDAVLGKMDGGNPGGRRIAPKVRVSLVDDKRRKTVVISVADNGGGIPEPALERIFDPFFTTKTEGHGTGLGLSIGYSIIDSMGGRIEARNADGGAAFQISLPVSADGPGAGEGRPGGRKPQSRTTKPDPDLPRILVVDDEQAVVAEVAEYLRRKGYDVVTAGNAREALKVHRARPADLVITDLLMPGMGGNELIQRLHRSDPDLPIVVVTGHTTFGDDRDAVAEGASVVLKKPIVLRELTDSLKGLGRR
jgi:PAS domain S-box-containing protein